MQPRKSRRRGVCGADEQPEQERPDTHVCSLANKLLAGLPSLTFFIMTGFDLIHSRITSCTNVRGAFVLIDPATACEREISYPAFKSAELQIPKSQLEAALYVGAKTS
jgi:hypothetical protein